MNMREEILKEHSRRQMLYIADWIGGSEQRFRMLLDIFLHDEYRVVQRSAAVVSYVADKHPELIKKHIKALLNRLSDDNIHVAVKRNVIRVLQNVDIPKSLHAKVMNACFGYLEDPSETIAVRCFSMTVLANLARQYPEIKSEIIFAITSRSENDPPGIKARSRKIIAQLEKMKKKAS